MTSIIGKISILISKITPMIGKMKSMIGKKACCTHSHFQLVDMTYISVPEGN